MSDSMVLIQAPKERNNLPKAGNDPAAAAQLPKAQGHMRTSVDQASVHGKM